MPLGDGDIENWYEYNKSIESEGESENDNESGNENKDPEPKDEFNCHDRIPDIDTTTITIKGYYKYVFNITAKLKDGRDIFVRCGGNKDDIYKFNPHGGFIEWLGAGNLSFTILDKTYYDDNNDN